MPAFNIQRARDHGIKAYAYYRSLAGLSFPSSWDELSSENDISSDVLDTLKSLYDHPRDIDLWIGQIAENTDKDFLLGPTQRCKLNFYFSKLTYIFD